MVLVHWKHRQGTKAWEEATWFSRPQLPEGTPANVALAEVLVRCCLLDKQLHLGWNIQSVIMREIPT